MPLRILKLVPPRFVTMAEQWLFIVKNKRANIVFKENEEKSYHTVGVGWSERLRRETYHNS